MSRLQFEEQFTKAEVAEALDLSEVVVARLAHELEIGANYRGRKGWRFTKAEVEQMRESRRPRSTPATADPRGRRGGARA